MRTHRQHQNIAGSFMENNLRSNTTVLDYIKDEASQQDFMNTLLAFYVLHLDGNKPKQVPDIQYEVE